MTCQVFPLSPTQRQILAESLQDPGFDPHTIGSFISFKKSLNTNVTMACFQDAFQRHKGLHLVLSDDKEHWHLHEEVPPLPIRIEKRTPPIEPGACLQLILQNPFDLNEASCLFKVILFEVNEWCEHALIITHHAICDGYGMFNLLQDALESRADTMLSEWHTGTYNRWLEKQPLQEAKAFWKASLAGFSELGHLEFIRPRPTSKKLVNRKGVRFQVLSKHETQELKSFAKKINCRLDVFSYGVWAYVLSRYCGHGKVGMLVPRSGRSFGPEGIKKMVGLTMKTLPLLINVRAKDDLTTYFQRIESFIKEMKPFEHLPLTEILQESDIENSQQCFSSTVIYLGDLGDPRPDCLNGAGVRFFGETASQVSLKVGLREGGFEFLLTYDRLYVWEADIKRFFSCLLLTLKQLSGMTGEDRVGVLPPMSPEEMGRLLELATTNQRTFKPLLPMETLFQHAVRAFGNQPMVTYEGADLSFADFDARAEKLANHLYSCGVRRGDIVAICLERSLEMVLAIYGIVKAGAAYLPLDVATPSQRMNQIIEDAKPRVLIGHNQRVSVPVVSPRGMSEVGFEKERGHLEELLYVIYTSGSTGLPKGVMCHHGGLLNCMYSMKETFDLSSKDCLLLKTPYTFDVSLPELFLPVITGARLVIARADGHKDPSYLIQTIQEQGVSFVQFVPSLLSGFLRTPGVESLYSLRGVLVIGEALSADLVDLFYDRCTAKLYNFYGPTEAAVAVTACLVESGQLTVGIGAPLPNCRAYVMDAELRPLPFNVRGELHLAGVHLAMGYLNRPDITAERFKVAPRELEETSRLYATGDLAMAEEQGTFSFLGRIDHQIKLRGHRIELGEIESLLTEMTGVEEAAVVVKGKGDGQYLAAYVIADGTEQRQADEMRSELEGRLPSYMVPSHFHHLEVFPLNTSGKLDIKALPDPHTGQIKTQTRLEGGVPENHLEEILMSLFKAIFGIAQCRRTANFFELGGNSLQAIHLVVELQETLGKTVSPLLVSRFPVLKDLAKALFDGEQVFDQSMVQIPRYERPEDIPATQAQAWMWLLHNLEMGRPTYTIPMAFKLCGDLNLEALNGALKHMTEHYEVMRTSFYVKDATIYQDIHEGDAFAGLKVQRCESTKLPDLWLETYHETFDLNSGPLWRFTLIREEAETYQLWIMAHHIICDAYGMDLFLDVLWRAYNDIIAGKRPEVPKGPGLPDLALWEVQQRTIQEHQSDQDYWRERLYNAPGSLGLDSREGHRNASERRGHQILRSFPSGLRTRLDHFCKRYGLPYFSVLLTSWLVTLSRFTDRKDQFVATTLLGRSSRDTQAMIGALLTMMPIRFEVNSEDPFGRLCQSFHNSFVEDRQHLGLSPKEMMSLITGDSNNLSSGIPCMFDLKLSESGERSLEALEVRPLRYPTHTAKMDILLSLRIGSEDMEGLMEYDQNLYESIMVWNLLESFQALLDRLLRFDYKPIYELSHLSAEQMSRLKEWNLGPEQPFHKNLSLGLEVMCSRHASKVALEEGQEHITYATLEKRIHHVSKALAERGIGLGDFVGIYTECGVDRIIALFSILRVGAAYVPLDTGYPQERLEHMVRDAQSTWVISSANDQRFPINSCEVYHLPETFPIQSEPFARVEVPKNAPAYISFTSGSTGRPKGAIISHAAASNFVESLVQEFGIDEKSRFLQLASPAFDAFVIEWGGSLFSGGTLVVVPRSRLLPGDPLTQVLKENRISHIIISPTIASHVAFEGLNDLKTILLGGEAVTPTLAKRLKPGRRVFNAYGPTEATVMVTTQIFKREIAHQFPIGRPLPNYRVQVLDRNGQILPPGFAGELCVGGICVSQGYGNQAAATAARFIPDTTLPGGVLYRTGDLVCFNEDGALVYLGRIDKQLKIRGHRIEPQEIEACLLELPSVNSAFIVGKNVPGRGTLLVAYVEAGPAWNISEARRHLSKQLPTYMMPSQFVALDSFPVNTSGKLDVSGLPEPDWMTPTQTGPSQVFEATHEMDAYDLKNRIQRTWEEVLGHANFDWETPFFEAGGNSILLLTLAKTLSQVLGQAIDATSLFQFPTISSFLESMRNHQNQSFNSPTHPSQGDDIAIIGMAGQFPGASSVEALWEVIVAGENCLSRMSIEHLLEAGAHWDQVSDKDFVPVSGCLEDVYAFDASYFGMSPKRASNTDPQQRLMLQTAHAALEHAGYDPKQTSQVIGMFAGSAFSSYLIHSLQRDIADLTASQYIDLIQGNATDFLTTKVAYHLGLTGPCVNVQTACSTSLVAVENACRAIQQGSCDMALAGGVSITFPLNRGYRYEADSILSPDGVCRPFDEKANGTVTGDGVGVVVLKSLKAARRDGDTIHAIIRASVVNNDGDAKASYTAPGIKGQSEAIAKCLLNADLPSRDIKYVETHGTATRLGDPIEFAALEKAFDPHCREKTCALGSLKANVGHLNTAAGIAGLIKTALIVREGIIPPMANFKRPNQKLGIEPTPFYVPIREQIWRGDERHAMVSSLGFGGTNAHLILSNPPVAGDRQSREDEQLLPFSAHKPQVLQQILRDMLVYLEADSKVCLEDMSFTLRLGRHPKAYRCAITCRNREEAIRQLKEQQAQTHFAKAQEQPQVAFLFPGMGGGFVGMGKELYQRYDIYRDTIDTCALTLQAHSQQDLRHIIFPDEDQFEQATTMMKDPVWEMVAIFTFQIATARLLMSRGIKPTKVLGLSLGEFAASCITEALSLQDAISLVYYRAQLCARYASGAMLMVALSPSELEPLLQAGLEINVTAAPKLTGVCGNPQAIEKLKETLTVRDIWFRCQGFSLAPHSSLLEAAKPEMAQRAGQMTIQRPNVPYISSFYGTYLQGDQELDATYWANHLRHLSRVQESLERLLEEEDLLVIDMGPGHSGASLIDNFLSGTQDVQTVAIHPAKQEDNLPATHFIGKLWEQGVGVDTFFSEKGRRIPLPTYPFEKTHFLPSKPSGAESNHGPLRFYRRAWREAVPVRDQPALPQHWLILSGSDPLGKELARIIEAQGLSVTLVSSYDQLLDGSQIDGEFESLFQLKGQLKILDCCGTNVPPQEANDHIEDAIEHLHSRAAFASVLANRDYCPEIHLIILSSHGVGISPPDETNSNWALSDGLVLVATQELPFLTMQRFDIGTLLQPEQVLRHLQEHYEAPILACTRDGLFASDFQLELPGSQEPEPIEEGSVFVISGGLGGLGMCLAEYLAKNHRCRLVLLSRKALPPKENWHDILQCDPFHPNYSLIQQLLELEPMSSGLLTLQADVTRRESLEPALEKVRAHFGPIDGVIHAAALFGLQDLRHIHQPVSDAMLRVKVMGTILLDELTRQDQLSHMILCSSLSGVVGGWRMSIYAAANAYLDAYALNRASQGANVRAIAWESLDMGETLKTSARLRRKGFLLDHVQVHKVFEQCLDMPPGHIIMAGRGKPQDLIRPDKTNPMAAGKSDKKHSLRDTVCAAWCAELGGEAPGLGANFFHMGGNSLTAIGIIRRLRQSLEHNISIYDLLETRTFGAFLQRIQERLANTAKKSYCVVLQKGDEGTSPLFLFPPAGGNLFPYETLPKYLDARIPVYGIKQKGADGTEPLSEDFESLIAHYLQAVCQTQKKGPYRLGGTSMGGGIAYELARRLRSRGEEVQLVVMLDTPGPQQIDAERLLAQGRFDTEAYMEAMSPKLLKKIKKLQRETKEDPTQSDEASRFDALFQANVRTFCEYQAADYDGQVLFLKAQERDPWNPHNPESPWIDLLGDQIKVYTVPGNHISMLDDPHVTSIAAHLNHAL